MPTYISSQFDIVVDQVVTAGSTLTITNPGRTMHCIEASIDGAGDCVVTFRRAESGGNPTTFGTAAMAWSPLEGSVSAALDLSNSSINTVTEQILIVVTGGDLKLATLRMIGAPSAELTAT
jgi:hypothetical protein